MWEIEGQFPEIWRSMLTKHCADGEKTIKGVEIRCKADKEFLNLDKFTTVELPSIHPIFHPDISWMPTNPRPIDISVHVDLPLLIRKVIPDPQWRGLPRIFGVPIMPYENKKAVYLNLITDTLSTKFGFVDRDEWDQEVGRVLVVRKDRKDIAVHLVEAMVYFSRDVIHPLILKHRRVTEESPPTQLSLEELSQGRTQLVQSQICRTKFEEFFQRFKQGKVDDGDTSWAEDVSPYDV